MMRIAEPLSSCGHSPQVAKSQVIKSDWFSWAQPCAKIRTEAPKLTVSWFPQRKRRFFTLREEKWTLGGWAQKQQRQEKKEMPIMVRVSQNILIRSLLGQRINQNSFKYKSQKLS